MKKIFTKFTLKERRQNLRKNMTDTESLLWDKLRNKKLGLKFRRQHSIGIYIVDFYCKEKSLIIELDGEIHLKNKSYDKERYNYLNSLGLNVIRFQNQYIENNIEKVIHNIRLQLETLPCEGEGQGGVR